MEFHPRLLDMADIHSRSRMRAGSTENGTRRLIDCVNGISSSTAGQHGDTLWIRHSHSQQSARAFNRDGYPASVVFMKHYLRLLVSMAVLHVTFTVAAECAGSTEIPGVQ